MLDLLIRLQDGFAVIISMVAVAIAASFIRKYCVDSFAVGWSIKASRFIDSKLTFIGVIHHEISHTLLAVLTGAKIKRFSLFNLTGDKLGEVIITTRGPKLLQSIQLTASAFAPVICGVFSIYYIGRYSLIGELEGLKGLGEIFDTIFVMSIAYHMTLSKQDIKVAMRGIIPTMALILIPFYYIDIDIYLYLNYTYDVFKLLGLNLIVASIFRVNSLVKRG